MLNEVIEALLMNYEDALECKNEKEIMKALHDLHQVGIHSDEAKFMLLHYV